MNREGKWLTDEVESEGQTLVDFEILRPSGVFVGYRGTWTFRNDFTCRETHRTWYEPAQSTQVHRVRTRL